MKMVMAIFKPFKLDEVRDALPCEDPFLDPAEVLVAHVTRRSGQRPTVVAVERHAPHR